MIGSCLVIKVRLVFAALLDGLLATLATSVDASSFARWTLPVQEVHQVQQRPGRQRGSGRQRGAWTEVRHRRLRNTQVCEAATRAASRPPLGPPKNGRTCVVLRDLVRVEDHQLGSASAAGVTVVYPAAGMDRGRQWKTTQICEAATQAASQPVCILAMCVLIGGRLGPEVSLTKAVLRICPAVWIVGSPV